MLKGKSKNEILISTYICHPQWLIMNYQTYTFYDVDKFFKKSLREKPLRFIFIPETIGSICFINKNFDHLKKTLLEVTI